MLDFMGENSEMWRYPVTCSITEAVLSGEFSVSSPEQSPFHTLSFELHCSSGRWSPHCMEDQPG